jgi:hypothetical protein
MIEEAISRSPSLYIPPHNKGIATTGYSWQYLPYDDPFPVKRDVHLLLTLGGKKTPTANVFFPSDQSAPNTALVFSSLHSIYLMTI